MENLTPVLLNAKAPLAFGIEAPWGAGKTTFIELWGEYLKSQGYVSLNLNAWESDFCEDPLLPLLSVLDDWLSELRGEGPVAEAWEKVKTLAPGLLKAGAVAAVKAGTFGVLDLEKSVEGAFASAAGEATGNIVDSFKSKKNTLAKFKELLASALNALPTGQNNLLIFVDELDRCRPSYALEVLERIKHLFDVERVVFVLAINRAQLGSSLQGVYGPKFDGESYLKRFIDLDYALKIPDMGAYITSRFEQEDILGRTRNSESAKQEFDWVVKGFCWLSERFNCQLRDVNQLILRFRLILRAIQTDESLDPQILTVMLFLREYSSEHFSLLVHEPLRINEVINFLIDENIRKRDVPDALPVIAGVTLGSLTRKEDRSEIFQFWCDKRDKFDKSDSRYDSLEWMREIAAREDPWESGRLLNRVYERVELVQRLNVAG
ncbi:KAP family P-loop NTPase fold protein [Microbulbifer pacificus]|uniref:P-loop NTPase fold protein n=1 Tax=Microbulbifer pacificus TaxID=407164 RepID=A0AAU0N3E6_9GAMM|nr:P-loop NTPase fold protein [Microbulbifer pacificus]WOX07332.1 P-loop NTPase fold protein [Microbulbifer pacificus]